MLNHLSLLKFKRHTTDTDVEDLAKELDELPNSIVEIQMLEFGRNVVAAANAYDFAVSALFANEQALGRCLRHPRHLAVMEKAEQICASIITVDFYGSDAGSLREKPPDHGLLEDDF